MTAKNQIDWPRLDNCLVCERTLALGSVGGIICGSDICRKWLVGSLRLFNCSRGNLFNRLNWIDEIEATVERLEERLGDLNRLKSQIDPLIHLLPQGGFHELKERLKVMIGKLEDFEKYMNEVDADLSVLADLGFEG
ncbi:MAG: hypothetical protein AAB725_02425 [Patescibacteria group bacterium]